MRVCLAYLLCTIATIAQTPSSTYFPPRGVWERVEPAAVGMDADRLAEAVAFAQASESKTDVDLETWIRKTFSTEPMNDLVGPTRPRGATNGILVRRGRIVAAWGPIERADMTFSVTKTYLSTVVGLAFAHGRLRGVHDPVWRDVQIPEFESARDQSITWDHLLRQTSDWRGTLFGKPDWVDRPPRGATLEEMQSVPLVEPGTAWEYNDVRVNLLALAALHVHRRPLPVVLREEIMDPIGASSTWRWEGYDGAWLTLDGQRLQSVSGGGHWGGGLFISTLDHARFAYLVLRDGVWNGKRLIASEWLAAAREPTGPRPDYGYMNWFLNRSAPGRDGARRRPIAAAPETAVTFRGAGSNIVYVDDVNDLVLVLRWIDERRLSRIVELVLGAIES